MVLYMKRDNRVTEEMGEWTEAEAGQESVEEVSTAGGAVSPVSGAGSSLSVLSHSGPMLFSVIS